jgi:hypothetical protein
MFGFPNYVINRRTGRPEEHYSWAYETLFTGVAWAFAAMFTALAVFCIVWGNVEHGSNYAAVACAGAAVLFSLIALWRRRSLTRRRQALRNAVRAYQEGLARAFE